MSETAIPESPESDERVVERSFGRSRRRKVRSRSSPRELDRHLAWLIFDLRRKAPDASEFDLERRATEELEALLERDPKLSSALLELAPSPAPDRSDAEPLAELAASLAHPIFARVLSAIALTPSRRGPVSDLSGAVAALSWMAWRGGACFVNAAYQDLKNTPSLKWALADPTLDVTLKQFYKQIITTTGR